jgi:hypothetical protein
MTNGEVRDHAQTAADGGVSAVRRRCSPQPVDKRPRPHPHRPPWLAADPTLASWQESTDPDVVQTGARILPDERPLPAELEAFLDAGTPPVYVGSGSMRSPKDFPRVAIEAIRAQGRRALVSRGWADLALSDDRDDCFALGQPAGTVRPAGRRRAPRRRGRDDDGAAWSQAIRAVRPRPPSPYQQRSGRP